MFPSDFDSSEQVSNVMWIPERLLGTLQHPKVAKTAQNDHFAQVYSTAVQIGNLGIFLVTFGISMQCSVPSNAFSSL